jgi:hypothetical protein
MTIQQALRSHATNGVQTKTIKEHLLTAAATIDQLQGSTDPAERIGQLISEAIRLAPSAGLFLKIRVEPAKKSAP